MSCNRVIQGRQKLARFSANEFATLVIDILNDAKRRQWGNSCESPKGDSGFNHQCLCLFRLFDLQVSFRLHSDNVELILQGIDSRHDSESQDNDQPDYDSVASDEDPVQEATCGDSSAERRAKVGCPGVDVVRTANQSFLT